MVRSNAEVSRPRPTNQMMRIDESQRAAVNAHVCDWCDRIGLHDKSNAIWLHNTLHCFES